jgi:predicted peroxiredoxin
MARILYISATGASDPTRASLAFHLAANGAAEAGHQADIVLAGDASELIKSGVAEGVRGVGIPPLGELLAKVRDKGIALHV